MAGIAGVLRILMCRGVRRRFNEGRRRLEKARRRFEVSTERLLMKIKFDTLLDIDTNCYLTIDIDLTTELKKIFDYFINRLSKKMSIGF